MNKEILIDNNIDCSKAEIQALINQLSLLQSINKRANVSC